MHKLHPNQTSQEAKRRRMKTLMMLKFLVSLFVSQQGLVQGTDMVTNTCTRAARSNPEVSYDFCVAYLQANPRSRRADLGGLGLMSLELASAYAAHTNYHLKELIHETGLDSFKIRCLKGCFNFYTKAIDKLRDTENAFKSGRYSDVNEWVNSVIEGLDICEEGFSGGDLVSPLTEENKDLSQLCSIALAITSFL